MYKFLRNLSCLLCLILVFGGCRKKAFDAYYGRPTNLAPPIYQVLQSRGNFTNLLACIDKAGYKATLSAAGYWTFFAPNDAAFKKYFTDNNLSLDKIDDSTAKKIVTYCLVFNAFQTDHIADYQAPTGWVPAAAYKRRTAYYTGFETKNPDTIFVAQNYPGTYVFGDNNNKHIPYFYSTYMAAEGLSAADYNYFWPTSTYTGFNVVNASVVNKDIIAENGVIHEIDQVVLPLPSIEQELTKVKDQYSVFKSIYDKFLVSYVADASYTRQYNTLTGKNNTIYVKMYLNTLAFAPGSENYEKIEDNDAQKDGFTLFAPQNAPLIDYLTKTVLEFYAPGTTAANLLTNMAKLPVSIITDFMNAHMFPSTVWPTKFATTNNIFTEPARFDASTDVKLAQFCSNGIFYGVDKVQRSDKFSTVYARAYLDPKFSIMTRLFDTYEKAKVTSPGFKLTVFMVSDSVLALSGYAWDPAALVFTQTVNGVKTSGNTIAAQLQRILELNIIPTPNGEMNDLSGDGIIKSNAGEYIKWHNHQIYSAGSVEKNTTLIASSTSRAYDNGIIYHVKGGFLDLATGSVAGAIAKNAGTATAPGPYWDFYNYMINSGAYNPAGAELLGVQLGADYTVFIPTQAAMQQAVLDGLLPGTYTGTGSAKVFTGFNYKPTTAADQLLVTRFIQFHVLNNTAIAPDVAANDPNGSTLGASYPTLLKDETGQGLPVTVFNPPGGGVAGFKIEDMAARFSSLVPATSNYLGNRVMIHQINNYLKYIYPTSN